MRVEVGISGETCPSPSDVQEIKKISVQKLSEVRVCPKIVGTLIIDIVLVCRVNNR